MGQCLEKGFREMKDGLDEEGCRFLQGFSGFGWTEKVFGGG